MNDKELKDIFHRIRTRALRGAEVRLDHVAEAQAAVAALVARREALARAEAAKLVLSQLRSWSEYNFGPDDVTAAKLENHIKDRLTNLRNALTTEATQGGKGEEE